MQAQERQHLPDDPARQIAVLLEIERVHPVRMVHERNRQVPREAGGDEAVERVVQAGELVPSGPCE